MEGLNGGATWSDSCCKRTTPVVCGDAQKGGQGVGGNRGCWAVLAIEGVDSRAGGKRSTDLAMHLERTTLLGCEGE